MQLPIDRDDLCRVLREHGVVYAYVFGSRTDGTARPDSDVDVAIAGDVDEWSLRGALPDVVDLTVLGSAPQLLAGRVANEGRVLFDDGLVLDHLRHLPDLRRYVAVMAQLAAEDG